MHLPALSDVIARLSLSDRATMATLHACTDAELVQQLQDAQHWQRVCARMPQHARAILERIRRLGGRCTIPWLDGVAGPLRSSLASLSPRTLLGIYREHSPLETLFLWGVVWQIDTSKGDMWVILPEIEAKLPAPVPVIDVPEYAVDADDTLPALDEVLCQLACLAFERRVPLQHHGKVSQVVLQRIAVATIPEAYVQWLVATLLAGGACIAAQNYVVPTQTMLTWFELPAHLRHQEVVRAWLNAAWSEWALGRKRRPPALDVRSARRAMLHEFLPQLPDTWCATDEVRFQMKQGWPDIFRNERTALTAGWHTRWDEDDGQLLTHILLGPLCWLGLVESAQGGLFVRRTALARWMVGIAPPPATPTPLPASLEADYSVVVPDARNILARLQLHRIATWHDAATAQLSPQRVAHALANGMTIHEYCAIVQQIVVAPVPTDMLETIRRWGAAVAHIQLTPMVMIHASDHALIQDIRHDRRVQLPAATWMSDTHLGIPPADAPKIARQLRAAGYIVDVTQLRPPQLTDDELELIEHVLQRYDHASEEIRQLQARVTQLRVMRGKKHHG